MDTSIIGLIVIATIAAVLLVAVIAWVLLTKRHQDRHDADVIGEDARRETLTVRQPEALADQTFASHHHLNGQRDVADVMSPLPGTRHTES
jgi:hypothetical protein